MKQTVNTQTLVRLALLAAVELVLAYTPLGYFRTAGLEISFLMIPVTLGAMLIGPAGGAVLGGIFGLTSFGTCFGTSQFGAALLGINPILTFLVCVPTRILAGWLAGVIFKAVYAVETRVAQKRGDGDAPKHGAHWLSFFAGALAGPVLNTAFFTGLLVVCFYPTDYIQSFVTALGAANPFMFILLFVGIQGAIEAVVGFIVSGVLAKAVHRVFVRE